MRCARVRSCVVRGGPPSGGVLWTSFAATDVTRGTWTPCGTLPEGGHGTRKATLPYCTAVSSVVGECSSLAAVSSRSTSGVDANAATLRRALGATRPSPRTQATTSCRPRCAAVSSVFHLSKSSSSC